MPLPMVETSSLPLSGRGASILTEPLTGFTSDFDPEK
jgi:hypothetical protein